MEEKETRNDYLKRQSWADRFYNDSRRAEFSSYFGERDLFLEFIDEAMVDGAKQYQERIKKIVRSSNSFEELQEKLKH